MNLATVIPPFGTKIQSHKEIQFHCYKPSYHCYKPSLDKGCNIKPLQKEVDHHLDLEDSRLQLR